jgi:hypothetical protein
MSKPIRTTRIVAKPMFYETVIFGPADAPLDPAFDSKLEAPAQDWIRWLAHRNEFKRARLSSVLRTVQTGMLAVPSRVAARLLHLT